MFQKLATFTKKVSMLADEPSLNATELKAQFDAAPEELRGSFNALVDALKLTTAGDSGAKNIGATSISGLTGNDVQTLLEALFNRIKVGTVSMTLTNNDLTSKAITFPTAFDSTPQGVFAMVSGQTTYYCSASGISSTGCTLYARRYATLSGSETFTVLWIAVA
jgi:hypothetical protein